VRIKDGGILITKLTLYRIAIPLYVAGRLFDRICETFKLGIDRTSSNEPTRDPKPLAVEHERFTDGDTWRNSYSL